jgi:WhiB family transcriptional regulator, redox-sensing transcriptional regulator
MGVTDVSIGAMNAEQSKWWGLGACRGLDAMIFYPDDETEAEVARSVCATCRVQTECLDHALTFREKAGVWGGATERDRRRMIRQRRKSA